MNSKHYFVILIYLLAIAGCNDPIDDVTQKNACEIINENCGNTAFDFESNVSKKYDVEIKSTCIVYFSVDNAASTFRFAFFNSSNKKIVTSDWIEKGSKKTLIVGPLEAGKCVLEIIPYGTPASSRFEFFVKYDCSDQTEPNNTFSQATLISPGVVQKGKILAKNDRYDFEDFDLYKFNIQNKPAVVRVKLETPSYIDPPNSLIQFSVLNSANSKSQLEYLNVNAGQTGSLLLGPLSIGEHYIAVNGTLNGLCNCESEGYYNLSLEIDQSDIHEPNDFSNEQSTNMVIDQPYKGSIAYPNGQGVKDVDWFKFTPSQSGKYQIQLIGLPTSIDTYAYIYTVAPNGNNYHATIRTNNAGTSVKDYIMDAGKEYWIRVELGGSSNESSGLYNLRIIAIK